MHRGWICWAGIGISLLATEARATPCTVEAVVSQINQDDTLRRVKVAKVTVPILDEIEAIVTNTAGPDVVARLSDDRARYLQIILSALVDGKPTRDANVVGRMNAAAQMAYSNSSYMPSKSDAAASMLWTMRAQGINDNDPEPAPTGVGCTMEVAIAGEQAETMQRLAKAMLQGPKIQEVGQLLQSRYGIHNNGKLDPLKMSGADAQAFETMKDNTLLILKELTFGGDLQTIREYWTTALLSYNATKQDLALYNDPNHFGDTISAELDSMTIKQQKMVGVWADMDGSVPSIESAMMQDIGRQTATLPKGSLATLQITKRLNERLPLATQP